MMQQIQNFRKNQNSTNLYLDNSFMMSLHNLVEERATQIQAVHSKKNTNCFINYVQICILPFKGGGG